MKKLLAGFILISSFGHLKEGDYILAVVFFICFLSLLMY